MSWWLAIAGLRTILTPKTLPAEATPVVTNPGIQVETILGADRLARAGILTWSTLSLDQWSDETLDQWSKMEL